jgi:hypothetical protein
MGTLVANTQKAIEEFAPDRERMDSEQEEKLNNFVKDLTGDVADMLTRFRFQKERKLRNNEQMSDDEVRKLADFTNFVKTLTEDLRSLLTRFQESPPQTFKQEFDKEVKQMEVYVQNRLKEFDEVLEDALAGRGRMFIKRLIKRLGNIVRGVAKPSQGGKVGYEEPGRDGRGMSAAFTGEAGHIREPGSAAAGFKTALGESSVNSKTRLERWF